jgi:hypothetical protein
MRFLQYTYHESLVFKKEKDRVGEMNMSKFQEKYINRFWRRGSGKKTQNVSSQNLEFCKFPMFMA